MNKRWIFLHPSTVAASGGITTASILLFIVGIFYAGLVCAEGGGSATKKAQEDNFFAIINGEKIAFPDFIYAFSKGVKEKFYHGKVSKEQLDAFKKETAEKLTLEVLLSNEATKRGLKVDEKKLKKALQKYDVEAPKDASEKEKQNWAKYRKEELPVVKASMEREQLIGLLKEDIEKVKPPPVSEVKAYYLAHKDKFTAPQRWDVSIILLPVDPSASSDEWDQTVEKADQLLKKINKGESFEELARIHSGDPSAADGGHMGYMHIGMFGEPAQKVLNVMDVGEVSEPVVLLEGVAIFRLNAVEKAALNPFNEVEARARKLLMRESGEKAWADFKTTIRKSAKVEFGHLLALDIKPAEIQK